MVFRLFSFLRFSFSTLEERDILISYKIINGTATIVWLVQSGEGVITAATINIAYWIMQS